MIAIKSPLEFSLYIEILLYMLVFVVILFFTNLALIATIKEESYLYKRFEAFVSLYVKAFSIILLITIIWIIVAALAVHL